jgi:integrase
MPYVVKHAGGQTPYWYAVYRDETGKRRKRSTKLTSKSKALEMANALHRAASEARRGALTEARTRELLSEILQSVNGEGLRSFTVEQWLELFVRQKQKSRAKGTFQRHAQTMRDFTEFLGYRARLNIVAITSKDVADFRDQRQSCGLAPATLNGDVAMLSSAFTAALKQGYISVNPCAAIEAVKDRGEPKSTFTPEQVAALVQAAEGDWRGLIVTAFYTGARLSDCVSLRWKSVDLVAEIKTIKFKQVKTGREVVTAIHPELEEYLLSLPAPESDEAFLFPTLVGRNNLSRVFAEIMKRAHIENRVIRKPAGAMGHAVHALSFHSLRHSFVSILANAGVDEHTRMTLTGHTERETQRRYTHSELARLRDAIAVLPRVISSYTKV